MKKEAKVEPSKLERLLADKRDWGFMERLNGLGHLEIMEAATAALRASAKRFDDERSLQYFGYLCAAIEDAPPVVSSDWVPKRKASKAMELWKDLPDKKPERAYERICEDESRLITIEAPALLVTKRALLDEVATRWAACGEDENGEANTLFRFLMEAKPFESFQPGESEERMATKAVGKACDQARPSRILEALAILPRPEPREYGGWGCFHDSHGEMRRKLVINLARQHPNFVTRAVLSWERLSDTKSAQRANEAERSVRAIAGRN